MDFSAQSNTYKESVERAFSTLLPPVDAPPSRLHAAMHYALAAGGKRLRPLLVLAAADVWPKPVDAIPAAVAIECLHTYTLVHDDLPAMDNSPLRRGVPSTHVAFGETTAILVGDALLTEAFAILAKAYRDHPGLACALIADLAQASGSLKLIGGQYVDTVSEHRQISAGELEYIHLNKTAALLQAALVMGLRHGEPTPMHIEAGFRIGACMGLAFQIVDDLLDVSSSADQLGKTVGADVANGKNTFVAMHGIDASRAKVKDLTRDALEACNDLPGNTTFLRLLITRMAERTQ
ncbi:MAG: polyprenyl synthetase family protein [Verrucomicrobia bacterium]|nr:polyprenyl synthetase family protein [Verrucomicrobiota bacterium]